MKNFSIYFILLSVSVNLFSQAYIPLIKEGKFWIYVNSERVDCERRDILSNEVIYFKGDTMINNIKYKKLFSSKVPYNILPYKINSQEALCYMREDTTERKVYMIQFAKHVDLLEFPPCSNGAEVCVWDFGLKPKDTLPSCMQEFLLHPVYNEEWRHYILDSISSFTDSLGISRRLFHTIGINPCRCGGYSPNTKFQYLEGFGNLFGPVFQCGEHRKFRSYCEGSESDCNIVIINNVDKISQKSSIHIEPNPASHYIKINTEIEFDKIEVINASGQIMFTSTSKAIDVESLQSGIYYVRCLSIDNKLYHSKFIKI